MQLCVLASGSRGNATLIRSGEACILIDCGLTRRQLDRRLTSVGLGPDDITAVVVTHEHSDHAAGIAVLQRYGSAPIHATAGSWRGMNLEPGPRDVLIGPDTCFRIADVEVRAVTVPHDAREPVQYRFDGPTGSIGVITDLGHATPHVVEQYKGCDGLLLECNHEPDLLQGGSYPEYLKRRIAGRFGHLANAQSAGLLRALGVEGLQFLIAGHLSEQNNTPDHALTALAEVVDGAPLQVRVAEQGEASAWFALA